MTHICCQCYRIWLGPDHQGCPGHLKFCGHKPCKSCGEAWLEPPSRKFPKGITEVVRFIR